MNTKAPINFAKAGRPGAGAGPARRPARGGGRPGGQPARGPGPGGQPGRLAELHEELLGYPGGEAEAPHAAEVVAPLRYRHGGRDLSFFSMTAVIGTPMDVTVEELAIESFYPADAATATALGETGTAWRMAGD